MTEGRNGAVSGLRTLLLESESESTVEAEKSEKGCVCTMRASTIPWSSPSRAPSVTEPTGLTKISFGRQRALAVLGTGRVWKRQNDDVVD